MRKILNKLLEAHGYRIERISHFSRLLKQLAQRKPLFKFVQVGANDGVRFDSLYFFVTDHNCQGLVIEPLPDMFERLRLNYMDYPKITPLNIALHPTAHESTIYRVDPKQIGNFPSWVAGTASFLPDYHERTGIPKEAIITETVKCQPLMQVLEAHGMLDADLLQIDTEGFDAEILKMADFSRFKPTLIKFEHKHLQKEDLISVTSLLKNSGYQVFEDGSDTVAFRPQGLQ